MDTRLLEQMKGLVQLDIDAFHAYAQAIKMIDITEVRETLLAFQLDHERHIRELSEAIAKHGGRPPDFARDFKGFLMEGMTAIVSTMGVEGALTAMRINEEATNVAYERAVALELPEPFRRIVDGAKRDERHHRQYIERAISQKVWQKNKGAGAGARR